MFLFVLFTLTSYLAIDFAVYWKSITGEVAVPTIIFHHFKMLPVYLAANVLLTIGFIKALDKLNPLTIFSVSIFLWVISLIVISLVLYQAKINLMSILGFVVIIAGVIIVNSSLK